VLSRDKDFSRFLIPIRKFIKILLKKTAKKSAVFFMPKLFIKLLTNARKSQALAFCI